MQRESPLHGLAAISKGRHEAAVDLLALIACAGHHAHRLHAFPCHSACASHILHPHAPAMLSLNHSHAVFPPPACCLLCSLLCFFQSIGTRQTCRSHSTVNDASSVQDECTDMTKDQQCKSDAQSVGSIQDMYIIKQSWGLTVRVLPPQDTNNVP
eukprot:507742-Pelagomonas_calceolata.AAC.15